MLDWLRYFPLTLRHSNQPVTPKGPYFPWMLKYKWQLRDSHFYLRCPLVNPVIGDPGIGRKSRSPARGDIIRLAILFQQKLRMPYGMDMDQLEQQK